MKSSVFFAFVLLASPAASFLLSKPAALFKPALKSDAIPSSTSRKSVRFQLSMSGRVPFIAGNWKMNPETVEQVDILLFYTDLVK